MRQFTKWVLQEAISWKEFEDICVYFLASIPEYQGLQQIGRTRDGGIDAVLETGFKQGGKTIFAFSMEQQPLRAKYSKFFREYGRWEKSGIREFVFVSNQELGPRKVLLSGTLNDPPVKIFDITDLLRFLEFTDQGNRVKNIYAIDLASLTSRIMQDTSVAIVDTGENPSTADLKSASVDELIAMFPRANREGRGKVLLEAISRKHPTLVFPILRQVGLDFALYCYKSDGHATDMIARYYRLACSAPTVEGSLFLIGSLGSQGSRENDKHFDLDCLMAGLAVESSQEMNVELTCRLAASSVGTKRLARLIGELERCDIWSISGGMLAKIRSHLRKINVRPSVEAVDDTLFRIRHSRNVNCIWVDFHLKQYRQYEEEFDRWSQLLEEEGADSPENSFVSQLGLPKELAAAFLTGMLHMNSDGSDLESWDRFESVEACRHRLWMKVHFGEAMKEFATEVQGQFYRIQEYLALLPYENVFSIMEEESPPNTTPAPDGWRRR